MYGLYFYVLVEVLLGAVTGLISLYSFPLTLIYSLKLAKVTNLVPAPFYETPPLISF